MYDTLITTCFFFPFFFSKNPLQLKTILIRNTRRKSSQISNFCSCIGDKWGNYMNFKHTCSIFFDFLSFIHLPWHRYPTNKLRLLFLISSSKPLATLVLWKTVLKVRWLIGIINILESGNSKFAFYGDNKTCLMGNSDIDKVETESF